MSQSKPSGSQVHLFLEEVRRLIVAKVPLVYVQTYEDHRCETALKELAQSGFQQTFEFFSWSSTQGLLKEGKKAGSEDIFEALDAL